MFYWKYNECSMKAIEVSQCAVTRVEMAPNKLILHSNTTAGIVCVHDRVRQPPHPTMRIMCILT